MKKPRFKKGDRVIKLDEYDEIIQCGIVAKILTPEHRYLVRVTHKNGGKKRFTKHWHYERDLILRDSKK
jgi:hypothetical protein